MKCRGAGGDVVADYLDILARAISDVGYWRWWEAHLPHGFQVEFGGAQLWNPPQREGLPPSGIVALRFTDPVAVGFLTHKRAPDDFPPDWPELLHNDSIEPLSLDYDRFGFNDSELIDEILSEAKDVQMRFGPGVGSRELVDAKISLAFWAGPAGLIVAAQGLTVLSFQGEIKPEEIERKYEQWWEYWKEYWRLRDTDRALPKDYACEVTIPAAE